LKNIDKTRGKSKIVILAEKEGGEDNIRKHCQLQDDPKYSSNV